MLIIGHATLMQKVYAFTFTTSYFYEQAYRPLQQLWSLSVEEQFYLLWPLLFVLGVGAARRCCWAVIILCPSLRLLLKHTGYRQYSHVAPAILDSIAVGCLLAFHQEEVRAFVRRWFVTTPAFLGLSLGTVLLAEIVYKFDLVAIWGLVPCLIAIVISAAVERKDRVLNSGPLVWSGLLSYSLYLWQQPFLLFDGPLNYVWVRLVFAFATAYASYKLVEQPVLRALTPAPRPSAPARSAAPLAQES
jgi:peptidoglycan/LPS O-acetylase OafA/YrhL